MDLTQNLVNTLLIKIANNVTPEMNRGGRNHGNIDSIIEEHDIKILKSL